MISKFYSDGKALAADVGVCGGGLRDPNSIIQEEAAIKEG